MDPRDTSALISGHLVQIRAFPSALALSLCVTTLWKCNVPGEQGLKTLSSQGSFWLHGGQPLQNHRQFRHTY